MRSGALAAAATVLVLAGGCGDDGPTGRDPQTVEVAVTDRTNQNGSFGAFEPAVVSVRVGDTMRWTQEGAVPHTVTEGQRGTAASAFDTLLVGTGQSFEFTFGEPGTFPYHCRPHFGMDGTVIVER